RLLPRGQTIHWVGYRAYARNRCRCFGGTGPQRDHRAAVQDEGNGDNTEDEVTVRQRLILEAMLANGITSERRRKSRVAVVLLVNRTRNPANYYRDFAALVRHGYLRSREGTGGGVWLTPQGKAEAERPALQS